MGIYLRANLEKVGETYKQHTYQNRESEIVWGYYFLWVYYLTKKLNFNTGYRNRKIVVCSVAKKFKNIDFKVSRNESPSPILSEFPNTENEMKGTIHQNNFIGLTIKS